MKLFLFVLLSFVGICAVNLLQAQQAVVPIVAATQVQRNTNHCCCDCGCDTTTVSYRPINHWRDVRHIFRLASVNFLNPLNVSELPINMGEDKELTKLAPTNFISLQLMGYDYMQDNFFVGGDMAVGFAQPSYTSANYTELAYRISSIFQLNGHLGTNIFMGRNLRIYAMGNVQWNHVGMIIDKNRVGNTQQAWHRFISNQERDIQYEAFIDNFIASDKWNNQLRLRRGSFATQAIVGVDYRYKRVKLGVHAGYSFQLSKPQGQWGYSFEYEDGDEVDSFRINDVPIRMDFSGLTAGVSFGVFFSDPIR
jgi:hypothetical protein